GLALQLEVTVTEEVDGEVGVGIRERINAEGLRAAHAVLEEAPGEHSLDATEDEALARVSRKTSLEDVHDRALLELVLEPVREQFEADLRALTDAEQDSKELKSAKRQLLFDRIIDTVRLPFPVGPSVGEGEPATAKDSITKNYVKKSAEAIYKELVRRKIAV